VDFPGARATQPLSQHGLIQNVQNYSSNPFWNPNSPYDQRMPQPVYAQGAALNAAECQSVAAQLVARQCAMKNNCAGARLVDIKPAIMVQLSQLQGHNYVGACAGYIDAAFNEYVESHQGIMQGAASFPNAVIPGSNAAKPEFKMENPYEITNPSWHGDEWFGDIKDRAAELKELQSQNGAGTEKLAHADMPATFADLPFTERMEVLKEGYAPWKAVYGPVCDSQGRNCHRACIKNCAYQTLNVESDLTKYEREAEEAKQKLAAERARVDLEYFQDPEAFCKKYKTDQRCASAGTQSGESSCVEKLKELQIAEETLRQLKECKAKGISLNDCYLSAAGGSGAGGSSSLADTGSAGGTGMTSVIAGAGTVAAIIMAAKSAKAAAAAATPVAATAAVAGTPAIPAVPGTPGTNFTTVSNVKTVSGVTTGTVNGQPVTYRPGTNGNPGDWRYSAGAVRQNGTSLNGAIASQAPISGQNTPAIPGTPAIPATSGTPASTNIKQTWRGARAVQGANANLRSGQVAGASLGGASTMAKVGGGLMAVGGVIGVVESTKGNEEHGWGNVLSGALSGAATGAGVGTMLNAIPVYGQVAFGVTVAATTVMGALTAGSQMFSETDCARDPFIANANGSSVFTCCHTQYNKGQRWVDIGGDMTCGDKNNPGIRTCLNGGSSTGNSILKDDDWSKECKVKYCEGWDVPEKGTEAIYAVAQIPWNRKTELSGSPKTTADEILYHSGELCWMWECRDGWTRSGARCISSASPVPGQPGQPSQLDQSIDSLIAQLEARVQAIRRECVK
jgi:hypothetical protein